MEKISVSDAIKMMGRDYAAMDKPKVQPSTVEDARAAVEKSAQSK